MRRAEVYLEDETIQAAERIAGVLGVERGVVLRKAVDEWSRFLLLLGGEIGSMPKDFAELARARARQFNVEIDETIELWGGRFIVYVKDGAGKLVKKELTAKGIREWKDEEEEAN